MPTNVLAELILISAAIPGGNEGGTCSCTNLTKNEIARQFVISTTSGSWGCSPTLEAGQPGDCYWNVTTTANCQVSRTDNKTLTAKQVACTFESGDDSGRVIVPVDRKLVDYIPPDIGFCIPGYRC